jgi:hypothetical protein
MRMGSCKGLSRMMWCNESGVIMPHCEQLLLSSTPIMMGAMHTLAPGKLGARWAWRPHVLTLTPGGKGGGGWGNLRQQANTHFLVGQPMTGCCQRSWFGSEAMRRVSNHDKRVTDLCQSPWRQCPAKCHLPRQTSHYRDMKDYATKN